MINIQAAKSTSCVGETFVVSPAACLPPKVETSQLERKSTFFVNIAESKVAFHAAKSPYVQAVRKTRGGKNITLIHPAKSPPPAEDFAEKNDMSIIPKTKDCLDTLKTRQKFDIG